MTSEKSSVEYYGNLVGSKFHSSLVVQWMLARSLFLSYSPVAAKFVSKQVAIVLHRKSFASLWNLVSLVIKVIMKIIMRRL